MATKSFIELSGRTKPTNLDVLALVDSGYTTTYQITRQNLLNSSSPLIYVDNKQNILSKWCDDTSLSSGQWFSTIIGGLEHRIEGDNFYNTILGGKRNRMTGGSLGFRTIVGGYDNRILNANGYNGIFAGYNNEINGGDYGTTILGGFGHTMTNNSYGAGIFGGAANTLNGGGGPVIVGGYGNSCNSSNNGGIFGGRGCSLTNSYEDIGASIWGSWSSTISAGSPLAQIMGGYNNLISSVSPYATILNGETNLIDNSPYSQILGGSGNTINCELPALERYNQIIGGYGNTIFDNGDEQKLQTIINSVDTTLTNGVDRVTAIGLSGRTINDAVSGTTYVENLKAFRQIASGFYDNGNANSGGITIDIKNGDKQQITITGTGTTSVSYIGNISGGRVVLKVINTSTGNIGFADNAPFDWKVPAILNPLTPSGTDIYVFDSFGDQSLWLSSHSQNLS